MACRADMDREIALAIHQEENGAAFVEAEVNILEICMMIITSRKRRSIPLCR